MEVKVAWRCNTEQWWWAEVPPSQAGPLYKKLGYSDDAIRAFGLEPEGPVGTPFLPAAAPGADPASQAPLMMEYPDQPRPPITVENVNSVMGKKTKKDLKAQNKHLFWARTECGLVLSSVTPWEIISKEKGVTTGGYMCKHCQGFWKQGRGATRLVQIIGRHRGRKISLQLIMDEPLRPSTINGSKTASSATSEWSQWQPLEMSNWIWVPLWQGSGSLIPMTVVLWDN